MKNHLNIYHQLIKQKCLLILKTKIKAKKNVKEIKDRISDLKDRIERMSDKEDKDKNANETLERLLEKFLIIIKMLKIFFIVHQKLIKENQNQRLKKVLQREQN